MKMKRKVTEALKKLVAGRQNYKCANSPSTNVIKNYNCPLWQNKGRQGSFGEEGYQIDHIIEHSLTQNDNESNLQALCLSCHSVKTRRFMIKNTVNTTNTIVEKSQNNKEEQKEEEVYEIEAILDKRKSGKKWEYLIKWKDYKLFESTWEPKENIHDTKILKKFEKEWKRMNKLVF
jgi:hypothetical protein